MRPPASPPPAATAWGASRAGPERQDDGEAVDEHLSLAAAVGREELLDLSCRGRLQLLSPSHVLAQPQAPQACMPATRVREVARRARRREQGRAAQRHTSGRGSASGCGARGLRGGVADRGPEGRGSPGQSLGRSCGRKRRGSRRRRETRRAARKAHLGVRKRKASYKCCPPKRKKRSKCCMQPRCSRRLIRYPHPTAQALSPVLLKRFYRPVANLTKSCRC